MMYGPGMIGTTPVFIDTGWSRAACGKAGDSLKWFSIIAIPSQNWHGALLVPRWWVASIISWLDSTQFVCTLLQHIFASFCGYYWSNTIFLVVPCPVVARRWFHYGILLKTIQNDPSSFVVDFNSNHQTGYFSAVEISIVIFSPLIWFNHFYQ